MTVYNREMKDTESLSELMKARINELVFSRKIFYQGPNQRRYDLIKQKTIFKSGLFLERKEYLLRIQ